jgi:hypothetical protein
MDLFLKLTLNPGCPNSLQDSRRTGRRIGYGLHDSLFMSDDLCGAPLPCSPHTRGQRGATE